MIGNQAYVEWMGHEVLTLRDLWPERPRAALVGINPAPLSVERGHYYQGILGQRLWARLEHVGLVPSGEGYEDDRAKAAGLALTDVVKRPTRSAGEVSPQEFRHGAQSVSGQLDALNVPLAIFAFKKSAEAVVGRKLVGNGFMRDRVGDTRVYVMPGPYEGATSRDQTLAELRDYLEG